MPSLKDTLELIITANAGGAIKAFEETGAAAEHSLGKAESSSQKLGGQMQIAGAGMIAFGAIAVGAMFETTEAFGKAEAANMKLENSLANSPKTAGESASAFTDLAEKLQQTTQFSHVATTEMESYLIQTGRTKEQTLELTPAIQDLSAKMGLDLNDAAKKVTMALNGKKKGLEALVGPLDAAKYATDRYGAVMDALGRSVGGFAAEQGKTFEGQLTIMKNNLKELEEGVGKGATQAFTNLFGAISTVTGALDSLSPGAQEGIGQWVTYGGVALIAMGAFNMVAGTVLKFAGTLGIHTAATVADTVAIEAETVALEGEAVAAEGASLALLGPVGALLAVGAAFAYGVTHAEEFSVSLKGVADPAASVTASMATITEGMKLTGISSYDVAKTIAEQSIPAALAFADGLDKQGQSSVEARRAIDDHKESLVHEKQAQAEAQAASEGTTVATKEQIAAMDAAGKAADGFAGFMNNLASAMDKSYQQTVSMTKLHSTYEADMDALTKSIQANGDTLDDSTDKGRKNIAAVLASGESIAKLIEKRFEETHSTAEATAAGTYYVAGLENQLRSAGLNQEQIDSMIQTMKLTPGDIATSFSNNAVEQQIVIQKYIHMLDKIDPEKQTQIEALINQGAYDGALALLNELQTPRTVDFHITTSGSVLIPDLGPGANQDFHGSASLKGTRAGGGPVSKGGAYLVGEHHAEVFVPNVDGTIIPDISTVGDDKLTAAQVTASHMAQHDVMHDVGAISDDQYMLILQSRLANAQQFSAAWYAIWQQINRIDQKAAADANTIAQKALADAKAVAQQHQTIHDDMFASGALSADQYLAMLRKRLAGTQEYSAEWLAIWQKIKSITDQQAKDEQAAAKAVETAKTTAENHQLEILRNEVKFGVATKDQLAKVLVEMQSHLEKYSNAWVQFQQEIDALLGGGTGGVASGGAIPVFTAPRGIDPTQTYGGSIADAFGKMASPWHSGGVHLHIDMSGATITQDTLALLDGAAQRAALTLQRAMV